MKSFKEIINAEFYDLKTELIESEKYFAHRKGQPPVWEFLHSHTELTLKYFLKLISANFLEPIIEKHIEEFLVETSHTKLNWKEFVKKAFLNTIYFHDFGKVNENFQVEKMLNKNFSKKKNGFGTNHSLLSTILYLLFHYSAIDNLIVQQKEKNILYYLVAIFSHSILVHHGRLGKLISFDTEKINIEIIKKYVEKFRFLKNIPSIDAKLIFIKKFYRVILDKSTKAEFNEFIPFSLLKLNSSLLTASDYLATNEFMSGILVDDFGLIDEKIIEKVKENLISVDYNSDLYKNFNFYKSLDIDKISTKSNRNLNLLRQSLAANVISELKKNIEKKLFYLEAPTGAGKTNISFLFINEQLSQRKKITKIFYVFPFTTLISQTARSIRETLKLDETEIVEIHSKSSFYGTERDDKYGNERKIYLDSLFINYPISLISHIKFFDILTSNEKEKNFVLYRLANSIVIIDEIQSYNPTQWDKINYLINKFSIYYNVVFLIMSATLPKIGKLLIGNSKNDNFIYLVSQKEKYFKNPNFAHRVKVEQSLLKDVYSEKKLSDKIYNVSENYFKRHKSVKTIVEFVTKQSAYEFYDYIKKSKKFSKYCKFLISGTILEPRRNEIIDFLKTNKSNIKILVITTQVIESGLDIDMDIGFKDKSIIDSEEQLAGRINRNAIKTDSKLFIFNTNRARYVYGSDLRYRLKIDLKEYIRILTSKNFDYYYQKVLEQINKDNRDRFLSGTLAEYKNFIKHCDFNRISGDFELIKNNTVSIFVPLNIKLKFFEKNEINFLENFLGQKLVEIVSGFDVWTVYEDIIENKVSDFLLNKINLKIITSIMSKFIFSIWRNPNEYNILRHYALDGEEKYGFLMLSEYKDIYSFKSGLMSKKDKKINLVGF